jgi:uncharacterized Fe-S center protein
MSNVYTYYFRDDVSLDDIKEKSALLLDVVTKKEEVNLENEIPLKVHFGEIGNTSYIKPETFEGIINYLDLKKIKSSFIETSVLYGGKRYKKELHLNTAKEHGFTKLPVVIADGEMGGDFYEVEINKRHFKFCKLGAEFEKYPQIIVLTHFKGHMLAGFGGALKNLAMGFASKGGKMEQHMGIKPSIKSRKCKKCMQCIKRCAFDAITIGKKSFIDHEKCTGCGACVSVCPHKAVSIISLKSVLRFLGIGNPFREKVAEYAYAANLGRKNIYINFIMNITKGCDCEPRKMKPVTDDVGIFASTDPLALDKACYEAVKEKGKKFRGDKIFAYSQKLNTGSLDYKLIGVE